VTGESGTRGLKDQLESENRVVENKQWIIKEVEKRRAELQRFRASRKGCASAQDGLDRFKSAQRMANTAQRKAEEEENKIKTPKPAPKPATTPRYALPTSASKGRSTPASRRSRATPAASLPLRTGEEADLLAVPEGLILEIDMDPAQQLTFAALPSAADSEACSGEEVVEEGDEEAKQAEEALPAAGPSEEATPAAEA